MKQIKKEQSKILADFELDSIAPSIVSALNRHFQSIVADAIGPLDLIVPEWRILLCLAKSGTCMVNDIVDYTSLPQSTVSRMISRLIKKKLITRDQNKADNRHAEINLTPQGLEKCSSAVDVITKCNQQTLNELSEELVDLNVRKWLQDAHRIAQHFNDKTS